MSSSLLFSQQLLTLLGTRVFVHHQDRVPLESSVLVISNHRSFMDAPLLMAAIDRPIRFACHHYMGQVPVLREFVDRLGCFPLDVPNHRHQTLFHRATQILETKQAVGIFPEGAQPMVQLTQPNTIRDFQRGFAHLALRSSVPDLAILPVAIAPQKEVVATPFPLKLLSWFDPSEPLFDQEGWHPMVVYRRVDVLVGHPIWIHDRQRKSYLGKQAKTVVTDLTTQCQTEINQLIHQVCD